VPFAIIASNVGMRNGMLYWFDAQSQRRSVRERVGGYLGLGRASAAPLAIVEIAIPNVIRLDAVFRKSSQV